jgi:hypothetical protein
VNPLAHSSHFKGPEHLEQFPLQGKHLTFWKEYVLAGHMLTHFFKFVKSNPCLHSEHLSVLSGWQ